MTTQLLTREQSGMRAPSGRYTPLTAEGITLHYGGPSPWGAWGTVEEFLAHVDHSRCASIWRAWQDFHMTPGALGTRPPNAPVDIAYTSGVCPHGVRFEGRGVGHRTAAQGTNEGNRRSYAVVYLAGGDDPLTSSAKLGFLDEQDRLGRPIRWVHNDWHTTACPGTPLSKWKAQGCPRPGGSAPQLPAPVIPPLIARTEWFTLEENVRLSRTVYPLPPLKNGTGYWDLDGAPGRPLVPAGRCMVVAVNGGDGFPDPEDVHGAEFYDFDGHTRVRLWGFNAGDAPSIVVTSLTD